MKLSSSLLVIALAMGASASPIVPGGFWGPAAFAQLASAASTTAGSITASVAGGSAAVSASVVDASVAPASTTIDTVTTATAVTAIGTTAVVASSISTAAATSTASAGDNASGNGAATDSDDPQTSLTLLASVIATGFENDGQNVPAAGQVPSLTSSNNFINFCATVPNFPLANGTQIRTGSCNPAPMGVIAATTNMPSSKFVFPANGATIPANTDFTIQMAIKNLETGNFANEEENYLAAPQQVNAQGNIKGISHIVVDKLPSLSSTTPTDPTKFTFFKGLSAVAQNGILTADIPGGLPAGAYRLASINTAANHQPALVAVAQHGALDDMVYFTVA
ncbi:hypothetical protein V8D89_000517 [Ganoderma adspersum]